MRTRGRFSVFPNAEGLDWRLALWMTRYQYDIPESRAAEFADWGVLGVFLQGEKASLVAVVSAHTLEGRLNQRSCDVMSP